MKIKLILSLDKNGCIGKENKLPWKLKDDLINFKKTTLNSCIIMGSNTYRSLPGILPNREHLVISSTMEGDENMFVFTSINETLNYLKENDIEESFLIGGANIVKQFTELKLIDEYILTHVDTVVDDGDTFINIDDDLELYKWEFYKELKYEKNEFNSNDFVIRNYKKEIKRFY